jgi:hypothetical protein
MHVFRRYSVVYTIFDVPTWACVWVVSQAVSVASAWTTEWLRAHMTVCLTTRMHSRLKAAVPVAHPDHTGECAAGTSTCTSAARNGLLITARYSTQTSDHQRNQEIHCVHPQASTPQTSNSADLPPQT